MSISRSEERALEIAENVTSIFSVLGTAFIVFTFIFDSNFRKPINRLVFFAAWGNLFANVATLISRSGINLGSTSPLCQFQAFLLHWFLPADALWTFAMAFNVYLSFFRQYDASQLKGLEWRYLGACYGIPFVPAIVFLFVSTPSKGKIFGDAVLWCWISPNWNVLRISMFYGPVWIVILLTFSIYVRVGIVVLKWRKQLLSINESAAREFAMHDLSSQSQTQTQTSKPRHEVRISSQVPHAKVPKSGSQKSPPITYIEESELGDPTRPRDTQTIILPPRPTVKAIDANKAAISYCKTAMLFFFALLCTWVPSTINRVYTLAHPDEAIFGFDLASSIVLPLQGFWNTVIYIVTSLAACKELLQQIKAVLFCRPRPPLPHHKPRRGSSMTLSRTNRQALGSDDGRADITMSMEGKTRDAHHTYSGDSTDDEILIQRNPEPGFHARYDRPIDPLR